MADSLSKEQRAKIDACLSILRRTPPGRAEDTIGGLADLLSRSEGGGGGGTPGAAGDLREELYQRCDPPLGHAADPDPAAKGRSFVISDFNRDGDSHRSPWTGNYHPALPGGGGFAPPPWLRTLEVQANELLATYRSLYYGDGGSVASAYLWEAEEGGGQQRSFAGAFLIKKELSGHGALRGGSGGAGWLRGGTWNSVHVVEVLPAPGGRSATYVLTTTVTVSMDPEGGDGAGPGGGGGGGDYLDGGGLGGTVTRRNERTGTFGDLTDHVINIGTMIEQVENDVRSTIDSVHLQKTKYVVDSIRSGGGGAGFRERPGTSSAGAVGGNQAKVATMLNEAVFARTAAAAQQQRR